MIWSEVVVFIRSVCKTYLFVYNGETFDILEPWTGFSSLVLFKNPFSKSKYPLPLKPPPKTCINFKAGFLSDSFWAFSWENQSVSSLHEFHSALTFVFHPVFPHVLCDPDISVFLFFSLNILGDVLCHGQESCTSITLSLSLIWIFMHQKARKWSL